MVASLEQMKQLIGHQFPGGSYEIQHWENYLLTEATGSDPLPGDLAHPIHLFHVPIAGVGVTLADLFALGQAENDATISIDYYDWEFLSPLREGVEYSMRGGVIEHDRLENDGKTLRDSITFRIEVTGGDDALVARVTFCWHFWRLGT